MEGFSSAGIFAGIVELEWPVQVKVTVELTSILLAELAMTGLVGKSR